MKSVQAKGGENADPKSPEPLVAAMMEPGFYPKPPAEVTHKETHISHLFFVGDLVYKVKKNLRYPFLDYSTLSQRLHFLGEELRLNRKLAPSVYLAIMPITTDGTGWQLGGESEPVEYALVMRRLPERRMMPFLLETHQVTPAMMRELAELLARFHKQADRIITAPSAEYPITVDNQWKENLADLEPFVGTLIGDETFRELQNFGAQFVQSHHQLLIGRAEQGRIRDVHGDLHCEHVCFAPEGIQIFDCVEFSPKLRCCDLASEMAFLLMDLEVSGGAALVDSILTRYVQLLEDAELPLLLPFYKCYRALVRGKVHALRSDGANGAAQRYFRFAARTTWEAWKPFLVIVCGLTGSGKSTLAKELAERLGMAVINSDVVRKAMAGRSGRRARFNEEIYTPAMTEKTYARMAREAEKQLLDGQGAILDATFGQRRNREKMVRLAAKHKVPLVVIHCVASEETTRRRLDQRAREGREISDGRWEIYAEQKAAYQPIHEMASPACIDLNTESPLDPLVHASESFIRSEVKKGRG